MTQRLHLVFGGELIDPTKTAFKDVDAIDIVDSAWATIVDRRAGELISVFSLAMKNGIRFSRWYWVVWPYPAYADVLGRAVDEFMSQNLANAKGDFGRWLLGRVRRPFRRSSGGALAAR